MRTVSPAAYEDDIISRLRNWRGLSYAAGGELFEEAAEEIERLRKAITSLAAQDATLTALEREAILGVSNFVSSLKDCLSLEDEVKVTLQKISETLWRLLERIK